jgi:hypothetical protein
MRMCRTNIYKQLFVHFASEPVFGQHTFYGALHNILWFTLQQVAGHFFAQSTGVAAKVLVDFLVEFVTGKYHLFGIGYNNVIATINVGRVRGLMFATQHSGYAGTHATYGLIGTVHNVPCTLYSSRVGMFGCKMKFTHYFSIFSGFCRHPAQNPVLLNGRQK